MMSGESENRDHDECIRIIRLALVAGINFVDTADVYSQGESEEIVVKALECRRDEDRRGRRTGDRRLRGGSWLVAPWLAPEARRR